MKFVILFLCLIAHFVIMIDKERIVVAVKITSDVDCKLLSLDKFTNYGTNGMMSKMIRKCFKILSINSCVFADCVSYQKYISKKPVDFVDSYM